MRSFTSATTESLCHLGNHGNEKTYFTTPSTSSNSVWITSESIMFSITSLNIQWGTHGATCEEMAHSRAHCPFRSRERPFQLLQWSLRSAWWARHERSKGDFAGYTFVLFKFAFNLRRAPGISQMPWSVCLFRNFDLGEERGVRLFRGSPCVIKTGTAFHWFYDYVMSCT